MRNYAIYIPTKNREEFAIRCAMTLVNMKLGLPIILVTERQHIGPLKRAWREELRADCHIELLSVKDRGIGYARHVIVRKAFSERFDTIAMIDDDQEMFGDISGWLKAANRPDVVGIGAWKGYYGLLWSKTAVAEGVKRLGLADAGLYGCAGAQGHQATVLNVNAALDVGNYDPNLRWGEDGDLARKGISYGYPWWVYTGVKAGDFATQRYLRANKIGGLQTPGALDSVIANHYRCHDRFSRYVSCPPARYAVKWKKMWGDYVRGWPMDSWPPGNVRSDRPKDWRVA